MSKGGFRNITMVAHKTEILEVAVGGPIQVLGLYMRFYRILLDLLDS
jgi:hypothetical protein